MLLAAANDTVNGMALNMGGDAVISLRQLATLLTELHGSGSFTIREFPAERKKIDIDLFKQKAFAFLNIL